MIGAAVVGCGRWGTNYVRALGQVEGIELRACCDPEEGRLAGAGRLAPSARLTSSYEELLAAGGVAAVVVASPAALHFQQAAAALRAGKHVLVEKPLALSVAEADELVDLARHKGLVLMVGHTMVYNEGIRCLREAIRSPDFGTVYYLQSVRTNLGPIREDVNAVWDLAPHDLSIFAYLLDAWPERVSAVGADFLRQGREDVAFITLSYPGGVVGHITVSWMDPSKNRQVIVVGSRRRALFDDLNNAEQVRLFDKGIALDHGFQTFGEFHYLVRDGDIHSPKIEAREPLLTQCQHFFQCVAAGTEPITGPEHGRQMVRTLTAVTHSLRAGGAPFDLASG